MDDREVDNSELQRLYDLIWKRTMASQMADAELEKTVAKINISTQPEKLTASGEVLKFDGFLKLYMEGKDDDENDDEQQEGMLPLLRINQSLDIQKMTATERFSRANPRYTAASLVKKLEEPVVKVMEPAAAKKDTLVSAVTKENAEKPVMAADNRQPVLDDAANAQKQVNMINSDCRSLATEDDFLKLRKKMAAQKSEENMVVIAKKAFVLKCYTTEQVRNLSALFLKDEGCYNFFDAAYPHVSDTQNYPTLINRLTDSYYINRFKAMIRQ